MPYGRCSSRGLWVSPLQTPLKRTEAETGEHWVSASPSDMSVWKQGMSEGLHVLQAGRDAGVSWRDDAASVKPAGLLLWETSGLYCLYRQHIWPCMTAADSPNPFLLLPQGSAHLLTLPLGGGLGWRCTQV